VDVTIGRPQLVTRNPGPRPGGTGPAATLDAGGEANPR
jgi:hypothetical protein